MTVFVGIDVAQASLVVAIRPARQVWSVANDAAGHAALVARLTPLAPRLIVLERTGGLEHAPAAALAAAALPVRIVNPRDVRAFARGMGQLAKTDRLDAAVLAHVAEVAERQIRPLPDAATRDLAALVARQHDLTATLVAERNRRRRARPVAHPSIDRMIAHLEAEQQTIQMEIAGQIAARAEWAATAEQLAAVPGIGARTAAMLLACLPELGTLSAKEIGKRAGVAPLDDESGTHRGSARIQGGRATVRTALWMATLTAARHNPVLHPYYERLLARHKPPKVALIACMRKLLIILNAMVRDGMPWQPNGTATP